MATRPVPVTVEINHPRYGATGAVFSSLRTAQRTLRARGTEWRSVTLRVRGDTVVDDREEPVGHVLRCGCCGRLWRRGAPPHG